MILTPVQAPNANAYAERVIETIRAECIDWSLILGRRHLDRTLRTYATHDNRGRPYRGLDLATPLAEATHPLAHQPAGRPPARPARRPHPRVLRARRVIESGFPTPTRYLSSHGGPPLRASFQDTRTLPEARVQLADHRPTSTDLGTTSLGAWSSFTRLVRRAGPAVVRSSDSRHAPSWSPRRGRRRPSEPNWPGE